MLVYVEFISRRAGASLQAFHTVIGGGQADWASEHPDDVMVASIGRTWWLGPGPEYLYAWWMPAHGLERLDDWEQTFDSGATDAFEESFQLAGRIDRAGCYEPLQDPIVGTTDRYYLEFLDFAPDATREDVRSLYARRCADNPELSLNLLVDRIGALAPEPRSLALWVCRRGPRSPMSPAAWTASITPSGSSPPERTRLWARKHCNRGRTEPIGDQRKRRAIAGTAAGVRRAPSTRTTAFRPSPQRGSLTGTSRSLRERERDARGGDGAELQV